MKKTVLAGIDVSAAELVVGAERDGKALPLAVFDNDAAGQRPVRTHRGACPRRGYPRSCLTFALRRSGTTGGASIRLAAQRTGAQLPAARRRLHS